LLAIDAVPVADQVLDTRNDAVETIDPRGKVS
jgi:hypothetical protein